MSIDLDLTHVFYLLVVFAIAIGYLFKELRRFIKIFENLRICYCCIDQGNNLFLIRAYDHYGNTYSYQYNYKLHEVTNLKSVVPVMPAISNQIIGFFQLCKSQNKIDIK